MLKASQKRTKRPALREALLSSHYFRLVGYDTDSLAVKTGETDDNVLGIVGMYFQKFAVIDDGSDNFIHIVSLVRIVRDDVVQVVIQTVDRVFTFDQRSFFQVVLRQEADQFADQL